MRRFSAVPWLDDADLLPMGSPETLVELGSEIAVGLHIPSPFGAESDAMLTIRAVRDTGEITVAVTNELRVDTERPSMDMRLLSGAKRPQSDDGGDGA